MKLIPSIYLIAFLLLAIYGCNSGQNSDKTSADSTLTNSAIVKNVQKDIRDTFYLKIRDKQSHIIAGKSIGFLKVGAKSKEILDRLGKPQKGDAGMCKSLSRWFYGDSSQKLRKELTVFSECDPKDEMKPHIKWVRSTDPAFKTQGGIGVNSKLSDIKNAYPSLKLMGRFNQENTGLHMLLLSSPKGISFEVEAGNDQALCRAVLVSQAGKELSVVYFPFYKNLKLNENKH